MSDGHDSEERPTDPPELELPEQAEVAVDGEGVDGDETVAMSVPDSGDDPFDDSVADDLPIDVVLSSTENEPSALGDDTTGLEGIATHVGVNIEETETSMIDTGDEPDSMKFDGDDDLGIDPIPREVDDGGLEGVTDPESERIDDHMFPPLDGDEDDDAEEELDVGIEIAPPPPERS